MNHLQHGHFMPNMERYSVDEFADEIALEDLEAQKAVKELEQQTGRLCKYSARLDFRGQCFFGNVCFSLSLANLASFRYGHNLWSI